jgi:cytochrome c
MRGARKGCAEAYDALISIKAFAFAAAERESIEMEDLAMRMRLTLGTILAFSFAVAALPLHAARAADANAGRTVFIQRCAICHSDDKGENKIGPTLYGVVGRKAGSVPGYSYSAANEKSNLVWTAAEPDTYLQNPRHVVPGTKMSFPGIPDATQRANVIAFLETLH